MDLFIQYAMAAAEQAMRQSEFKIDEELTPTHVGVLIGVGIGGLCTIEEYHNDVPRHRASSGSRRFSSPS